MADIPRYPTKLDPCGIYEVEEWVGPSPKDQEADDRHLDDIYPFNRHGLSDYTNK